MRRKKGLRSRSSLGRSRSSLERRLGLQPTGRLGVGNVDVEAKRRFQDRAAARSNGRCVVSGELADDVHHVIPKQKLRQLARTRRFKENLTPQEWTDLLRALLWDDRNGVAVSRRIHDLHTKAIERIPRSALPDCVFEFAREHGFETYVEANYPEGEKSDAA